MNVRVGEIAIVGAGLAYLVGLAWAMGAVSYDIWGVLVVVPQYGALGIGIDAVFLPEMLG